MASTIKLIDQLKNNPDAANLGLGRMDVDGMPFRGPSFPMREEEYDELTEVTSDNHAKVFDVMTPEGEQALSDILDHAANGWYVIICKQPCQFFPQPDGAVKGLVYCEWSVPHRQLNMQRAESWGQLPVD